MRQQLPYLSFSFYIAGARDPGASNTKTVAELEKELELLDSEIEKTNKDRVEMEDKLAELTTTKDELLGLADYKKKHLAAIRDDVTHLRDGFKELQQSSATPQAQNNDILRVGDDLLDSLRKEKEALEARRRILTKDITEIQ
jgi:chromosome segregation ATPase